MNESLFLSCQAPQHIAVAGKHQRIGVQLVDPEGVGSLDRLSVADALAFEQQFAVFQVPLLESEGRHVDRRSPVPRRR